MWTQVKCIEDFRRDKDTVPGWFIIEDNANPNKLHTSTCRDVREGCFREKVICHKETNGRYLFTAQREALEEVPPDYDCLHCSPRAELRQGRR